jgi:hypothetical protein
LHIPRHARQTRLRFASWILFALIVLASATPALAQDLPSLEFSFREAIAQRLESAEVELRDSAVVCNIMRALRQGLRPAEVLLSRRKPVTSSLWRFFVPHQFGGTVRRRFSKPLAAAACGLADALLFTHLERAASDLHAPTSRSRRDPVSAVAERPRSCSAADGLCCRLHERGAGRRLHGLCQFQRFHPRLQPLDRLYADGVAAGGSYWPSGPGSGPRNSARILCPPTARLISRNVQCCRNKTSIRICTAQK